jgi:hypothetical protein
MLTSLSFGREFIQQFSDTKITCAQLCNGFWQNLLFECANYALADDERTPRNRVLRKLIVAKAVKKFPSFMNQKFITMFIEHATGQYPEPKLATPYPI